MTYRRGDMIGQRYQVVQVFEGGMGVVYLCAAPDGRPVALKTFKSRYFSSRAVRDRFLREAVTWVSLGYHQHVVQAYTVERVKEGAEIFLVSEGIIPWAGHDGSSLRAALEAQAPFSLRQALLFALHITRGMRYAASTVKGLVHCDLKPENILLSRDGHARITDFGLARTRAELPLAELQALEAEAPTGQTRLTRGGIAGSPPYMAPEQWRPGERLDARADIYALGCILYEMATGWQAVTGRDQYEYERAHCTGQAAKLAGTGPVELRSVIQRCTAVGRDARFSTWDEVETELSRVFQHVTGTEPPPALDNPAPTQLERVMFARTCLSIGACYTDLGEHQSGLGFFEKALTIAQAEGEKKAEADALHHIGSVHYHQSNERLAIEFYERALAIVRATGNLRAEGMLLDSLANAYSDLGQNARAIDLYQKSLLIERQVGNRGGEGITLGNMAAVYTAMGNTMRAVALIQQSLEIAEEQGDLGGIATNLFNLARNHAIQGNRQAAVECAALASQYYLHLGQEHAARAVQEFVYSL